MWCYVTLADSSTYEVRVDPKSIGQDVLEEVCKKLDISNETDYFGLKYTGTKNEELWLNLRNPIERQVGCGTPVRLEMHVKFWVPPHLLLQETTRHQFYLEAKHDLVENKLKAEDWSKAAKLIGLIAQVEAGEYDPLRPPHGIYSKYSCISATDNESKPSDFMHRIVQEHKESKGMKKSTAEYWLLKHVSNLESFGEEMFHGKAAGSVTLGVGPHGISVYNNEGEKQIIPYTAIQSASSHRRVFRLEYVSLENQDKVLEVKQDSSQTANGLYRAITEKHAFYSCETVRSAVTAQYIRNLKGTIASIFNEDSTLGKKYVFDIRKTCREVYDNARRALYQGAVSEGVTPCMDVEGMRSQEICTTCQEPNCTESHEKSSRSLTCRICMDRAVNTIFLPCTHGLACAECADRCDRCPICRGDIMQKQPFYLI